MLPKMLSRFVFSMLLVLGTSLAIPSARSAEAKQQAETGILEKMIPSNGIVTMDLDVAQLGEEAQRTFQPFCQHRVRRTVGFKFDEVKRLLTGGKQPA